MIVVLTILKKNKNILKYKNEKKEMWDPLQKTVDIKFEYQWLSLCKYPTGNNDCRTTFGFNGEIKEAKYIN